MVGVVVVQAGEVFEAGGSEDDVGVGLTVGNVAAVVGVEVEG